MSDPDAGHVWTTPDGHLLRRVGEPAPIYSHSPVRLPDGTEITSATAFVETTPEGRVVREYGAPFTSTLEEFLYVVDIHIVRGDTLYRLFWTEQLGREFRSRLEQERLLSGLTPWPAPPHFEIVPGESIGPFRLGMTAAEARTAAAPLLLPPEAAADTLLLEPLALTLRFNAAGRCREIEARVFSGHPETEPRFLLHGQEVNNIGEAVARARFPTLLDQPGSGLRSRKWEATDDFLFALVVHPPAMRRGDQDLG